MVLQKRLDYGFIGYQVPPIPRAKRSARGRAPYRKKVEDNRTFAFDLLATVAGKLLLEEEFPPTAVVNRTCHDANVKDGFNKEPPDKHALPKVEPCDQGNTKIGLRAQELAFSHGQNYKGISDSQHSACSRPASGLTISDCSVKISSDPIFVNNDKGDFSTLRKFEGSSSCPRESSPPKLEDDVKQQNQSQQVNNGDMSLDTGTDICGSEDPKFFNRKPHALVSADNGGKVSMCKDHCTCGSPSLCRDNVTVVSRDDDENSSGCTQPSTSIKSTRSLSHIGDCRIRKLLASKYWRLAPKVKDGDLSDTGGEILPIYHSRKNGYKRQRSQRIYPLKKRRLFDYVSVSNSKGELGCNSIYDSTEKARDVTASGFGAKRHGATDASSSVAVDNASFLSRDPRVKVRIKSFRIPELFIEIPETATVGSLKRTVLEAVTALLGDGLHVGVLFQGKKIRNDNRTLLQSGISHDNKVDALGFTLEPSPSQAFPPMHFEGHPLLLSDDSPLPVSRCSLATSIVQQGAFYPLAPNPATNVGSSIESDHDSAPSPEEISTEKGIMNTRALVPVPDANAQALAVLPLQQKSKRTEMAQRRIRRPFSVSEVEALVQAVEKLGTGRWRDVKLRAFDNVKHRTYVDLKDKWKTLVHTARISPQQRRGEPVPQELLDRVLTAHSYWSQQQAKHQLKQQSEACLLA